MTEPRKRWVWGFYPFAGWLTVEFALLLAFSGVMAALERPTNSPADWLFATGLLACGLVVGRVAVWLAKRGD